MEDVREKLADYSIRAECIIDLSSMVTEWDCLPSVTEDLLEDNPDVLAEVLGGEVPDEAEEIACKIIDDNIGGLLVRMETPVPQFYGAEVNSYSYSWGLSQSKWFYGKDLNEIYDKSIVWVKEFIAEQKKNHLQSVA